MTFYPILSETSYNMIHLSIGEMTCASCSSMIEHTVKSLNVIQEVTVNLTTNPTRVKYDSNLIGMKYQNYLMKI